MSYKEALDQILQFLKENHLNFYLKETEDSINTFIDSYIKKNPITCDEDFTYLVRIIIKKVLGEHDSHTRFKRKENRMPLYFKYLEDGFYVVKNAKGFEQYKFAKLLGINGIPIGKIFSEIEKSTCYSTKGHLLSEAENHLSRTEVLILPSIAKNHLTYRLLINEKEVDVPVDLNENYEYSIKNHQNYYYYIKNDTLILTYNSCKNHDLMKKTVKEIKNIVEEKDINNFILDLRGNDGGNSGVIMPLINYLKETHFNLVTLVDRYVYSSGRWAMGEMRRLNSILIGEETGTALNCFGENKNYNLEVNGINHTISYSTKYFGFDKNHNLATSKFKSDDLKNTKLIFDSPDIYVDERIEDLQIGSDKYLESAYNYLDSIKTKINKG